MKVWKAILESGEPKMAIPLAALDTLFESIKDAEPGERIVIEVAEMTEEEFDKLPEY